MWTSAAPALRSTCGSCQAIRSSWLLLRSSIGSTPGGTRSGRRVTAASRSPAASARAGELTKQVQHVGLVPRAVAAEDVGIHDDERMTHASSRQSASTWSAARFHVNARARSSPSATSSSRRRTASTIPAAI